MFPNLPHGQSIVDQVVFGKEFEGAPSLDPYEGSAGCSAWTARPVGVRVWDDSEHPAPQVPEVLFRGDWGMRPGADAPEVRGRAQPESIEQSSSRAGRPSASEQRRRLREVATTADDGGALAPSLQTNAAAVIHGKEGEGKPNECLVEDAERSIRSTRRRNFHGSPLREATYFGTETEDSGGARRRLYPDHAGVAGAAPHGERGLRTDRHAHPDMAGVPNERAGREAELGDPLSRRTKRQPAETSRAQASAVEEVVFRQGVHGPVQDFRFRPRADDVTPRRSPQGVRAFPGTAATVTHSSVLRRESQANPDGMRYTRLFNDSAGMPSWKVRTGSLGDTAKRQGVSRSASQPNFGPSNVGQIVFGQ